MQPADSTPPPGVVELREDIPLKAGGGSGGGCGTPRLIACCFAALSVAVTVALLTQIYYGDYQVVPHGSVSCAAEVCSAAGTGALKAGGRAMDAAAAAALCLTLLAPHRTSIDASGSLLYWEYRDRAARQAGPDLIEWGGEGAGGGPRAPRLLAALAHLHAQHGALPWAQVLQPTIDLARQRRGLRADAGYGHLKRKFDKYHLRAAPSKIYATHVSELRADGRRRSNSAAAWRREAELRADGRRRSNSAAAWRREAELRADDRRRSNSAAAWRREAELRADDRRRSNSAAAWRREAELRADDRRRSNSAAAWRREAELQAERHVERGRREHDRHERIDRNGFTVSKGLALAASGAGRAGWLAGGARVDSALADYLETLQRNSSAELSVVWSNDTGAVSSSSAQAAPAAGWMLYAGGPGAVPAARALITTIKKAPADADEAERWVVEELVTEAQAGSWPPGGVATGLAVVDSFDTYIALVTGLSLPFGSLPPWGLDGADAGAGGEGSAATARDAPGAPIDLAPAILLNDNVCGTRYVIGAESSAALAQAAAVLFAGAAAEPGAGVERARVGVMRGGAVALESAPPPALSLPGAVVNGTPPYAAVNVVQQRGDVLASHADSRSGGLSSRF